MIEYTPPAFFVRVVLPSLLGLAADTVPNVRIVLARTLRRMLQIDYLAGIDGSAEQTVTATLERLARDTDRDVVYFSASSHDGADTIRASASIPTV